MPLTMRKKPPGVRIFRTNWDSVEVRYVPGKTMEIHSLMNPEHPGILLQKQPDGRIINSCRREETHLPYINNQDNSLMIYRPPRGLLGWRNLGKMGYYHRAADSIMMQLETSSISLNSKSKIILVKHLAALTDQHSWHKAIRLLRDNPHHPDCAITLDCYNWAIAAGPFLEDLLTTNPGAVQWLLAYCRQKEPVRHPGQIISTIRDHMTHSGIPPAHWRVAATLPKKVMQAITHWATPEEAARAVNIIVRADAVPSASLALRLSRKGEDLYNQNVSKPRPPNEEAVLLLACRESAKHTTGTPAQAAVIQNLTDTLDYARAMTDLKQTVRSTTWNGVLKASRSWHRNRMRDQARRTSEQIASSATTTAWNTLIGETTAAGLKAIPLTDEAQLIQESMTMNHCVFTHTSRCAAGMSRIFSLQQEGRRIATGEISLEGGAWEEIQTRGRNNRSPDEKALRAMHKIAQRYTRAWKKAGEEDPHTSWRTDQPTQPPGMSPSARG